MNAYNRKDQIWLWLAAILFVLNLGNLVAWALHFPISSFVYCALIPVFFLGLRNDPVSGTMTFIVLGLFVALILGTPLFDWDARYIWFFHAKRIFMDNELYAQLDDYFPEIHNDYPVLIPALAASLAKTVGYWNEVFPRLAILFAIIPIFLGMKTLLKEPALYGFWLAGVLIAAGKYLVNGYMDAILGLMLGFACSLLIHYHQKNSENSDRVSYLFLCLLLFSLPHIKNEGLLASLLIFVAMAPQFLSRKRDIIFPLLSFAFYYFTWKKWVSKAGIVTTDLFVPGILDRLQQRLTSSSELYKLASSICSVSALYFLILWFLIWQRRENLKSWLPSVFVVGTYSFSMVVIYLITALDLKMHLDTSVDRTFMVVNLSVLALLVCSLGERSSNFKKARSFEKDVRFIVES